MSKQSQISQTPNNLPDFSFAEFVDREMEQERIFYSINNERSGIIQIIGMGGIGKTALAGMVARRALDRGMFSGGIIWISCRGVLGLENIFSKIATVTNTSPKKNIRGEVKSAIYDYLSRNSTLLILDDFDAVDTDDEIISFLARIPKQTIAIITSRREIKTLRHWGRIIQLNGFDFEAIDRFFRIRAKYREDERLEYLNPDIDVNEISELTGGNPLLLSLIADLISKGNFPTDLFQELSNKKLGDSAFSIKLLTRIVNEYRNRPGPEGDILSAISMFDGPALPKAIASVGNIDISTLQKTLKSLMRSALIQKIGERYDLTSFVRSIFRQTLISPSNVMQLERPERKYVNFYKNGIATADRDFIETEWLNIRRAVEISLENRWPSCTTLILGLSDYLFNTNKEELFLEWSDKAISVMAEVENQDEVASLVNARAVGLTRLGRFAEASSDLERILDLRAIKKNPTIRAIVLSNLSSVYLRTNQYENAIRASKDALVLSRRTQDKRSELTSLGNLALVYKSLGEQNKSLELLQTALLLSRELGDQRSEATTLGELAESLSDSDPEKALSLYQEQLGLLRRLGDNRQESVTLSHIGSLQVLMGNIEEAVDDIQQALRLSKELKDVYSTAINLQNMASVLTRTGRLVDASALAQESLLLSKKLGSNFLIAKGYEIVGDISKETEKFHEAIEHYQSASELYLKADFKTYQATIYRKLAEVYESMFSFSRSQEDLKEAEQYYENALKISQSLEIPLSSVLIGLSRVNRIKYESSGNEEEYLQSLELINRAREEVIHNKGKVIDLAQVDVNVGALYLTRYKHTGEKSVGQIALSDLREAFLNLSADKYPSDWLRIASLLSGAYIALNLHIDLRQFANEVIGESSRILSSKNDLIRRRASSLFVELSNAAAKFKEDELAISYLLTIINSFESNGQEAPLDAKLSLGELQEKLGEKKFAFLAAKVEGHLSLGLSQLLEEARELMEHERFIDASDKLTIALENITNSQLEPADAKRQKATILFLRGLCLRKQELWEIALKDQEDSFRMYEELNDPIGEAHALLESGLLYELMNNYEDARWSYMDAYRLYKSGTVQDKKGMAIAAEHLGRLEFRVRMFPQAARNLDEARNLYIELGDREKASSLLVDLEDAKAGLQAPEKGKEGSHV